jgi:hypothetical protein
MSSPTVASAHGRPAFGWLSRPKTPFLVPPTRMDSGGGGEVGEVSHVLTDKRLDAVETRWFIPSIRPGIPRSRASGRDRVRAGIGVGADGVADDVDSATSSGLAGTPTSFVNGRRQFGAYDIDTLTVAVKTAKAQPKLDVPYRPGQIDAKQADAAVLPAWSPERALRKPTPYRASRDRLVANNVGDAGAWALALAAVATAVVAVRDGSRRALPGGLLLVISSGYFAISGVHIYWPRGVLTMLVMALTFGWVALTVPPSGLVRQPTAARRAADQGVAE